MAGKVCWANHSGVSLKWVLLAKEGNKQGALANGALHFEPLPSGEVGAGWILNGFGGIVTSVISPPRGLAALQIAFKTVDPQEAFEDLQRVVEHVKAAQ